MTPSVDPHGRRLIGRPTTSSTGHPAGAFESSSRFKGASEMEAKAIKSIDSIALACLIISQDHLLIDRSPGGAIPIVYDDQDCRRRGRSQRPRRRTSRRLARRLLRRKISPHYRTLSIEGDRGPPEASDVRTDDDHGPWPPLSPDGSGSHGPKLF